ncbi:hypothetical protein JYU34_011448 [Plutella xylostella]|uniref:Dynein regulatory complex protein 9 n=1 Tax=Plutella xylostella TaxID=51655 RepID=A0ABQ7QH12_PLUXY|nr:hypothetical protein JYU34_011448 [Plutella xylostella]
MEVFMFCVILEVALQQMKVVDGCSALQATQNPAGGHTMLEFQRAKLLRDRKLLSDIIRATVVEMAETGGWRCLRQAIISLQQRAEQSTVLQQDHDRLRLVRAAVTNELKSKKKQNAKELRLCDTHITFLKDKKEDDIKNAELRLVYADKWLNAQAEVLEMQHRVPRAARPSATNETRVHRELSRAYDLQVEEREKAVEYWRAKYSDDTSSINMRLAVKCEQLRVAVARREELQKLYNLHEGEMRSWLTFKRERAARLEREERVRRAATTLQAWWRGLMVRRGLGAFKHLRSAKKTPNKMKKK